MESRTQSPPVLPGGSCDESLTLRAEIQRLMDVVKDTVREHGLLIEALEQARGEAYMLLLATKGYKSLVDHQ